MGNRYRGIGHGHRHMYIDVILKDGTYHHFTPMVLNVLLESNRVQKFRRSNGWATVGIDPVRIFHHAKNGHKYNGPERRLMMS